MNDAYREFLEKLAAIVGANMAELGRQRAASAAAGSGKAAVYDLEKKLAELEAGTVLEPYTGEDLKESLKAAEVCIMLCHLPSLLLVTLRHQQAHTPLSASRECHATLLPCTWCFFSTLHDQMPDFN